MKLGRDIVATVVASDSPLGRVARAVDVMSAHMPTSLRTQSLRGLAMGKLIQNHIVDSGRSQREVSDASGIDPASLSRFLNGSRTLSDGDLSVLAWAVGLASRDVRRALVDINQDHDESEWWVSDTTTPLAGAITTVIRSLTATTTSFSPHTIPADLTPQRRPAKPITGQYLIGRAALDHLRHGDQAAHDQAQCLYQLAASDDVTIRLVDIDEHIHPFQLLALDGGYKTVKVDILDTTLYLDDINRFQAVIETIKQRAVTVADSLAVLGNLATYFADKVSA
ncbi:Scr1 family TA system antitoxin-like transcriptional regulator [Actinokineospora terrae]|uniref:Helix-turn-helix domain-containing protein n=1 Tax=Actinokineospora terrae TaxID=155974 RepID=A0A1H9XH04_9PSEU|nr:Scr1 family TA system antitoxin-like transcriptional regulator [Actinokineospora terrae]SES45422.1 Helix-turn-helix domain-containing protein [Actinokineospora terrae]